jgi:hypothetical protein
MTQAATAVAIFAHVEKALSAVLGCGSAGPARSLFDGATQTQKGRGAFNSAPGWLKLVLCYSPAPVSLAPSPQKAGPLIEGYSVTAFAAAVRLS